MVKMSARFSEWSKCLRDKDHLDPLFSTAMVFTMVKTGMVCTVSKDVPSFRSKKQVHVHVPAIFAGTKYCSLYLQKIYRYVCTETSQRTSRDVPRTFLGTLQILKIGKILNFDSKLRKNPTNILCFYEKFNRVLRHSTLTWQNITIQRFYFSKFF